MKSICSLLLALTLFTYAYPGMAGELLGRISDETAQPAAEKEDDTTNKSKIIYRVICPVGGETSPECGQAPISDAIEPITPAAPLNIKKAELPAATH